MSESKQKNTFTGLELAVIGMAGRFPGAKDINEFWENLKNGVESFTFFSDQELETGGVETQRLNNPNFVKTNGGLLEDKEYFDAFFFSYKSLEATTMDPQIRIFHECTWEALENAGYEPYSYDKLIGLYAGASDSFHWKAMSLLSGQDNHIGRLSASLLSEKDQLVTRVSYNLGLKGPGVLVQSACSTSLVAIHMASQALLNGECDIALAGGVKLNTWGITGYVYQEGLINSSDGHCRAFDAQASGIVSGEGVGVVILKLLENAIADKDYIHAVIKGSSINNDGLRKVGYTAPSVIGQAEVIKVALQAADVEPGSIGYVETHGTGTLVGDPIEIEALKMAFTTEKKGFCALGAVKTNVGHLDAAAGVTGFIKTILILKHGQIPPNIHFKTANPKIDFENSPFYVNTTLKQWNSSGCPRRAGVSSFGIGGTNAHIIMEEAPFTNKQDSGTRKYQLMLLSTKTPSALSKMTDNLTRHLKANPGISLADAAYTLQIGRKSFNHREMLACSSIQEAIDAFATGSKKVKTHLVKEENESIPVVFIFAGQGSQYVNMGADLYRTEKDFRHLLDHCFEILQSIMDLDLKKILYPAEAPGTPLPDIHRTSITQPILFAFEYALAQLLIKWGIQPQAMIGYSLGEYTAACTAGVFTLEDALNLVALRGKLMQEVPPGAMLSVPLSEEQLKPLLNEQLSLAIINNPTCIVAGSDRAIDDFEKQLKEKRLLPIRLHSSHAAHSLLMDSVIEKFMEKVTRMQLNKPRIPYISNLTGTWITAEEAVDPLYWGKHLRGTVRFSDGLTQLLNQENSIFVEIGPGRVLGTFVRQHHDKNPEHKIINLIRHPQEKISDDYLLLSQLGQLWLHGKLVDWPGFYGNDKRHRIPLPSYPFERQRFWIDADPLKAGTRLLAEKALGGKKPDMADWFYIPSWKRSRLSSHHAIPPCCLVLTNSSPLGTGLVEWLKNREVEVIVVKQGQFFHKENDREYTINPTKTADYDTLFNDLRTLHHIPTSIVHLWNVTHRESMELNWNRMDEKIALSFYSLIYLAQSIGRCDFKEKFQILVVTNHMQEVQGESLIYPHKSLLLGPLQVIPREYTNIDCRTVDVVLSGPGSIEIQRILDQLAAEMSFNDTNRIIAYRSSHRWVRVFEPIRLEKTLKETGRLKNEGVYLITGGLGGIGHALAEYLAQQTKAKLVLTGRSKLPQPHEWDRWLTEHDDDNTTRVKIQRVKQLKNLGAEVLVLNADITNYSQMETVIRQAKEQFGRINGIIHAAGLPDYAGVIQRRSQETIENILAPKVKGTLILDTLLKDMKPDFFILCSSLASMAAPFGQVAYTAANNFLDAFAHYKTLENKDRTHTASINWDFWNEVGMGVEKMKKAGEADKISPENGLLTSEGKEVLGRILAETAPQVVVSTWDLTVLLEQSHVPEPTSIFPSATQPPIVYQRPQLSSQYVVPRNELEHQFAEMFQVFLGIQQVGIDDNFFELGLSSLDIIHISAKLKEMLGKDIPPVIMFEYPTIASLAQHLGWEDSNPAHVLPHQKPTEENMNRAKKIDKGKNKLKQIKKKQKVRT